MIYYDVTNLYFKIGNSDDDILDGNHNIIQKSIRKMEKLKYRKTRIIKEMLRKKKKMHEKI